MRGKQERHRCCTALQLPSHASLESRAFGRFHCAQLRSTAFACVTSSIQRLHVFRVYCMSPAIVQRAVTTLRDVSKIFVETPPHIPESTQGSAQDGWNQHLFGPSNRQARVSSAASHTIDDLHRSLGHPPAFLLHVLQKRVRHPTEGAISH